jgi:serine/threonine-protein kinase PknG
LYDIVSTVDPSMTSASFGLARCLAARGDALGAVAAYRRVPAGSSVYVDAQVAAARLLVARDALPSADAADSSTAAPAPVTNAAPGLARLTEAAAIVERLGLDVSRRATLAAEVLQAALDALAGGLLSNAPDTRLFGHPVNETGLRRGLERAYRDLARLAPTPDERLRLVDLANHVRPVTVL